jgi:hypothetical protein
LSDDIEEAVQRLELTVVGVGKEAAGVTEVRKREHSSELAPTV